MSVRCLQALVRVSRRATGKLIVGWCVQATLLCWGKLSCFTLDVTEVFVLKVGDVVIYANRSSGCQKFITGRESDRTAPSRVKFAF